MRKPKSASGDELRKEYHPSDFSGPLVRGKYAERLRESSNVIVLDPKIAEAFSNEEAVNDALRSLIDIAERTTRPEDRVR